MHYLVRDPERGGQPVYPRETLDRENQSYGSLFVELDAAGAVEAEYDLDVLSGDEIMTMALRRVAGGHAHEVAIPNLGAFRFTAGTGVALTYAGSMPDGPTRPLVPLRPEDPEDLEILAMLQGMVFVGRTIHPTGVDGVDAKAA